ncbi:hypothetical protein E1295_24475 [Nonomuraea mesophila]|uniref:Uncharacterized protein n=1 Tax=Nonomuraea mesophila TaxID=2530382 RepID=A0A4V2Z9P3_9ACTN|nr:hypothetical protein [Nonomuraea mesophila]TDE45155.1 hypothetical protein E1295_24475 [Nonomuraea mesophila]
MFLPKGSGKAKGFWVSTATGWREALIELISPIQAASSNSRSVTTGDDLYTPEVALPRSLW